MEFFLLWQPEETLAPVHQAAETARKVCAALEDTGPPQSGGSTECPSGGGGPEVGHVCRSTQERQVLPVVGTTGPPKAPEHRTGPATGSTLAAVP